MNFFLGMVMGFAGVVISVGGAYFSGTLLGGALMTAVGLPFVAIGVGMFVEGFKDQDRALASEHEEQKMIEAIKNEQRNLQEKSVRFAENHNKTLDQLNKCQKEIAELKRQKEAQQSKNLALKVEQNNLIEKVNQLTESKKLTLSEIKKYQEDIAELEKQKAVQVEQNLTLQDEQAKLIEKFTQLSESKDITVAEVSKYQEEIAELKQQIAVQAVQNLATLDENQKAMQRSDSNATPFVEMSQFLEKMAYQQSQELCQHKGELQTPALETEMPVVNNQEAHSGANDAPLLAAAAAEPGEVRHRPRSQKSKSASVQVPVPASQPAKAVSSTLLLFGNGYRKETPPGKADTRGFSLIK